MSSIQTPTLQACRECGAGAPLDAHFCPQCTKILSLPRHADYFSFLGLPRKLNLDAADLDQRFRSLSRQFHPDYFYNATTVGWFLPAPSNGTFEVLGAATRNAFRR